MPHLPMPREQRYIEAAERARQNSIDADRYKKLRRWMSSNVQEGWEHVERLAALAVYAGWDEFDEMLDSMPECNVGLCHKRRG